MSRQDTCRCWLERNGAGSGLMEEEISKVVKLPCHFCRTQTAYTKRLFTNPIRPWSARTSEFFSLTPTTKPRNPTKKRRLISNRPALSRHTRSPATVAVALWGVAARGSFQYQPPHNRNFPAETRSTSCRWDRVASTPPQSRCRGVQDHGFPLRFGPRGCSPV